MVVICSGLLLVKTKQCCAPFPQTAIKLEMMIIYSLVFQRCLVGSEASLGWALFTYIHRELQFFIPRNLNLKWNPQMKNALTSGCYQILLSTISKPNPQQYGFLFFPPQLERKTRCRITATADWTGWEDTLPSTAEAADSGCFSFLHQNIPCHSQSRPPEPIWELSDMAKHKLNCLWMLSWRFGPGAAFFLFIEGNDLVFVTETLS